jgi:4-carboxymuconolactone decarboxylase
MSTAKKKEGRTMSDVKMKPEETLQGLSQGDINVVSSLLHMHEGSFQESGLDPQTFMLVRMAALTTLDAAPASWMLNLQLSGESGLAPEQVVGMLIAIAPVIGTARVVSAASHIIRAMGLAEALAETSGT